jgi:predicted phosphodiesterase
MKLAVLADIHGNCPALEAVTDHIDRWQPDVVVVAGDIVNRGPRSLDCWRFVRARQQSHGWRAISGNHDLYALHVARGGLAVPGVDEAVRQNTLWTRRQLGRAVWEFTMLPPETSLVGPDGGEVRIVHASMRGNRDNIFVDTPDDDLREKIAPAPALFCCGHTHKPLIREIDRTLVVNVGSVGVPFDGDVRACYAQVEWRHGRWQAQLVRLDYDREQTERDFHTSGFLTESGVAGRLLYAEFQTARPHLSKWMAAYREAVLSGALALEDSSARYLSDAGL